VNFDIKIADFGFAQPLWGKDGSYKIKDFLGTLGYLAPEILQAEP
jgi:serine/threonine protein kinase